MCTERESSSERECVRARESEGVRERQTERGQLVIFDPAAICAGQSNVHKGRCGRPIRADYQFRIGLTPSYK